jgi:hypothetical protein
VTLSLWLALTRLHDSICIVCNTTILDTARCTTYTRFDVRSVVHDRKDSKLCPAFRIQGVLQYLTVEHMRA